MAKKYPFTFGSKVTKKQRDGAVKSAQILGISESEFNRQALEEKVIKVLPDFSFDDTEEQNAEECKEAELKSPTVEIDNANPLRIDIDEPVIDNQESEARKKFVRQFIVNKEEIRAKYEPIINLVLMIVIIEKTNCSEKNKRA